jgi:hypothetical protein
MVRLTARGAECRAVEPGSQPAGSQLCLRERTSIHPAASGLPVVVSCTGYAQTRPGRYVLACGDGNAYLTGLHWSSWGAASAFAAGTDNFKVCIPSCTAGRRHNFPALAALWRAEPLPGHPGMPYFTRLTVIYTGSRSYRAGGKTYHLPRTVTYPLSAAGGA